jgi:hypothetical protein
VTIHLAAENQKISLRGDMMMSDKANQGQAANTGMTKQQVQATTR